MTESGCFLLVAVLVVTGVFVVVAMAAKLLEQEALQANLEKSNNKNLSLQDKTDSMMLENQKLQNDREMMGNKLRASQLENEALRTELEKSNNKNLSLQDKTNSMMLESQKLQNDREMMGNKLHALQLGNEALQAELEMSKKDKHYWKKIAKDWEQILDARMKMNDPGVS